MPLIILEMPSWTYKIKQEPLLILKNRSTSVKLAILLAGIFIASSSNIPEAIDHLTKAAELIPSNPNIEIMLAGLLSITGSPYKFTQLLNSEHQLHYLARSFNWFFQLHYKPKVYFNRWDFFDYIILQIDKSKPFYEFGVWRGHSFEYLMRSIKTGFGFDTFEGLLKIGTWKK